MKPTASERYEQQFPALVGLAHRTAYRIGGNIEDAEDIAIETLARAYVRWNRVEGYATRWVVRVATNLAIDAARRHVPATIDPGDRSHPVDSEAVGQMVVAEALRSLSRRQREVMVLTVVCDLSMVEAGHVLGMSVGSVKQHSHRALANLRAVTPTTLRTDRQEQSWTPTH
jgi:RNA polymerase sigma factor (sigma-70 family)